MNYVLYVNMFTTSKKKEKIWTYNTKFIFSKASNDDVLTLKLIIPE